MSNPYTQSTDAYEQPFTDLYLESTPFDELSVSIDDDKLAKMLVSSLEDSSAFWNEAPWKLKDTDVENTKFLLGDQIDDSEYLKNDSKYIDNRLFSSVRAILSYATGQLAKPDIIPSKGDDIFLRGARNIGQALYQHASDAKVDLLSRSAVMNLITRKRGFLKLRWNPNLGLNGDIETEVCNPEDIIIDRNARYLDNPDKIYHRVSCSIDELVARFPNKKNEIFDAFAIRRGVYTQTSRTVTHFECWFSYTDDAGIPKEGVAWFIPEKHLILDKMPNPNWVYMQSRKKEKEANVTSMPPKPFVVFNYMNTGRSYIDETCLVEQAKPQQIMLNKRGRQIWENADYAQGRWIASKRAFNESDVHKMVNKGAKTIGMVDSDDVTKAFMNVAPTALPSYVESTLYDARNEIDGLMGTPSQFKGSQPDKKDTLGRDLMVKQQAGALQDDLVRCVSQGMEEYYKLLLQMMRVYYTDDYWFQCKGGDGKYEFILLNGDSIDSNVKVSVQVDSTLPLDKAMIRTTAMQLWSAGNAIDYRTLMEDLGLPNPEIRTERYLRSHIDPIGYLNSIESQQMNDEAETDIMLLTSGKTPEERDVYDEKYINYYNMFVTSNRFAKLDQKAKERIIAFLMVVQHVAQQTANLQGLIDDAGITTDPITPPAPQKSIKIMGTLDPQDSAQEAGIQPQQPPGASTLPASLQQTAPQAPQIPNLAKK